MLERIHIFCNRRSVQHDHHGRQQIETFVRKGRRWRPEPPVRARKRNGDWAQVRHPSTERIVDAAHFVYRVEFQRMPETLARIPIWPASKEGTVEEYSLPVHIETRSGHVIEFDDIPRIDYRYYDLQCPCGMRTKPTEESLAPLLDEAASTAQGTIALEFVRIFATEAH